MSALSARGGYDAGFHEHEREAGLSDAAEDGDAEFDEVRRGNGVGRQNVGRVLKGLWWIGETIVRTTVGWIPCTPSDGWAYLGGKLIASHQTTNGRKTEVQIDSHRTGGNLFKKLSGIQDNCVL